MALTTPLEKVEALYIAYFGRAGDPSGVTYWVDVLNNGGKSFADLAGFFAIQPESIAAYPYLANPALVDPASFVTQVYQNLFARAPDTAGLNYWVTALGANQGNPAFVGQFINYVIGGAAPADVAVLDNKVAAGIYFTQVVATKGFDIIGPDGQLTPEGAAAAKAATGALVTGDPASVEASKAATDAFEVTAHFHLTTGIDDITGTAGADTFTAGALAPDGVTPATTLNLLDKINGGGGIDTLILDITGDVNLALLGDVRNVENLTVAGTGFGLSVIDAGNFSGTIKFQQTALQMFGVDNVTGQTLVLDRVESNSVLAANYADTQSTATLKAMGNPGSIQYILTGQSLKTVDLTIDRVVSDAEVAVLWDAGDTVERVDIHADGASTIALNMNALKSVTVSGAGAVMLLDAIPPTDSIDATASTGGVKVFSTLENTTIFKGGAGDDDIAVGANTRALTLGGGNDILYMDGPAFGLGGSADGGDGIDTLVMFVDYAEAASADKTFAETISNFEKLNVGEVGSGDFNTIDLANLDNISYVISSGVVGGGGPVAGALVLDNFASGGTFELNDEGFSVVNVRDAAAGADDVLNVVLTNCICAPGSMIFGAVLAADVETVNIRTNGLGGVDASVDSLTLVATSATKIVLTGNNGLTLDYPGNTKVISFDASGVAGDGANDTSANLAVTFTSANTTGAVSITGGAGDDVLTGNNGIDTIMGGAGNDTISGGFGLDILTGGAGNDVFALVANSNGNIYATITDASAGDVLSFVDKGTETFDNVKVTLADTAVFQDYLNEAAKANITNDANFSWFQWAGNTYVVEDLSANTFFENGTDIVVRLSGLVDVSGAVQAGHELTLA